MERVKLRAWIKSDIPALAKYRNNKKIWDNCRDVFPYPYTKGMLNSLSISLKVKVSRAITASKSTTKRQKISASSEVRM